MDNAPFLVIACYCNTRYRIFSFHRVWQAKLGHAHQSQKPELQSSHAPIDFDLKLAVIHSSPDLPVQCYMVIWIRDPSTHISTTWSDGWFLSLLTFIPGSTQLEVILHRVRRPTQPAFGFDAALKFDLSRGLADSMGLGTCTRGHNFYLS